MRFFCLGLPQAPDDLEGGVGLAGAGGHDQQDAPLPAGDGLDGAVDGVDLVVARRAAAAVVVVRRFDLGAAFHWRRGLSSGSSVARVPPGWGTGRARLSSRSIWVPVPVRSWNRKPSPLLEDEGHVQRLGIVQRLLHAGAERVCLLSLASITAMGRLAW